MTKVYLFKAPSKNDDNDPDSFTQELEKEGFSVETIPVIQFTNVNVQDLATKLQDSSHYSGLILTSKRAVEAIGSLPSDCGENPLDSWREKPVFVVGPATADSVAKLGLKPSGEVAGNADNLSDWIVKHHHHPNLPLLFPHGDLARNVICTKLQQAGVAVENVVVYQTEPHHNLPDRLAEVSNPDFFVYFSPSGVAFTIPLLRELEGGQLWKNKIEDRVKFVVIGPTTKAHLENMEVQVFASADQPTPAGVLAALKQ